MSVHLSRALGALALLCAALVHAQAPAVGPNVNMVGGTRWPEGDPFLTKQNEPSIAVSSRNPRHLFAASNDYRLVPVETAEELDDPEAWVQIYKSVDGGLTWRSTPLGGCPINIPACTDPITKQSAPLRAVHPNFGADPTARPGPYGTFFLSSIAGTRDTGAGSVVVVQRFVDTNDDLQRETDVRGTVPGTNPAQPKIFYAQDSIIPDTMNIVDQGTPGQSIDKPWVTVDVGGRSWNAGKTCELLSWTKTTPGVRPAAEVVPAFNVYASWANFKGQSANNQHPDIYVATSTDCGKTFGKPVKLTAAAKANQGSNSAIDPLTGAVYVVWRNFDGPMRVMLAKSTDGGNSWSKPVNVTPSFYPYDQGATSVSFRTLDFPSIAVSVQGNQSRVHVAWSQRKADVGATAPYACTSATAADCDARIVLSTSFDGGGTWSAPQYVDGTFKDPLTGQPGGRGHQVQPAMSFAAGRLLVTWLDQRLDQTEGVLKNTLADCIAAAGSAECKPVAGGYEYRVAKGNLDPSCHVDTSKPDFSTITNPNVKAAIAACKPDNKPTTKASDAVWSTYITDGTIGLTRRHTIDAYVAIADPTTGSATTPIAFQSTRASQYLYGNQTKLKPDPLNPGKFLPDKGVYDIVQKEVSAPNLPMFSNGTTAFIGDYIDAAAQIIVSTDDTNHRYKFNVGGTTTGNYTTNGFAPAFHLAFTDNRDVVPPTSGDWRTPTCLVSAFTKDPQGNVTGVSNTGCGTPGYAGNRNQNVYTTVVAESSVAFTNSPSKQLSTTVKRGFIVTVRNLDKVARNYTLSVSPPAGVTYASFSKTVATTTALTITVQPRSTSSRTLWVLSSSPSTRITVNVSSPAPAPAFSTNVVLNADPIGSFVTNTDGPGVPDSASDDLGAVVLSNAVLSNNALSNVALSNNVLSNNALTNAALSNVVLSNDANANVALSNAALSNDPLSDAALSNAVLSNVALSNNALSNNVLSNNVLSNVALSNNALSNVALTNSGMNVALTNVDPSNVALSNAVLSNNALSNVALSNNALSNAVLSNNVLSNVALSNVVLSNAALSNNALSNNALSNTVLRNAALSDSTNSNALSPIEVGYPELNNTQFTSTDLNNSAFGFKETTFTVRNRGNTDTTISFELLLNASCVLDQSGAQVCTLPGAPASFKLQLLIRKVALVPVSIPPTTPAVDPNNAVAGNLLAVRIGVAQALAEVSNLASVPIVNPNNPTVLPDDPNAAVAALAPGERAYVTLRAIGVGGEPPDPAELLKWGVKPIGADTSGAGSPFDISILGFADDPNRKTNVATTLSVRTNGGSGLVTGTAVCADSDGNTVASGHVNGAVPPAGAVGSSYIDLDTGLLYGPFDATNGWGTPQDLIVARILRGNGAPAPGFGFPGNFYIDVQAGQLYGPQTGGAWGPGRSLTTASNLPNPQAIYPCPPAGIAVTDDGTSTRTARLSFTPLYWGNFFNVADVFDGSAPAQEDRQLLEATVHQGDAHATLGAPFPPLTYGNTYDLYAFANLQGASNVVRSDSPLPFGRFTVVDPPGQTACRILADGRTLQPFEASTPSCTIQFDQQGNETYAPASVVITLIIVNEAPTTTTLATSAPATGHPANPVYGETFTLTTTISPANFSDFAATGSVTLSDNGTSVASGSLPQPLQPQGVFVFTINPNPNATSFVPAGTHPYTAAYGGDHNYLGSSTATALPQVIDQASTTTAMGSSSLASVYGQPITLTATVAVVAPGRGIPTGTVTFTDTTQAVILGTSGVNGSGIATLTLNTLAVGGHSITASYGGDGNYKVSSNSLSQTVTPAATTTTVASSLNPSIYGQSVTFTATVKVSAPSTAVATPASGSIAPPTGSVTIKDGPTALGTGPVTFSNSAGTYQATFTVNTATLDVPSHTITAQYTTGDGNYVGSDNNAAPLTQVVNQAAQVLTFGQAPTPTFGDPPVTVSTTTSSPTAPASLSPPIVFGTSTSTVCTIGTSSMSIATATVPVTILAAGSCTITATQIGNTNYKDATPNSQTFIVAKAATQFVSPLATDKVYTGLAASNTTLSGSLAPAGTPAVFPTGNASITVKQGATTVATYGPVLTAGAFTTTNAKLPSESYVATFSYAGDSNFNGATDVSLPLRVEGFSAPAIPMVSARAGHTITLLTDGNVLITGGADATGMPTNTAEVFCASQAGLVCASATVGTFKPTVSPMSAVRVGHTATRLPDGNVLVAGGSVDAAANPTNSADIYCAKVAGPVCTLAGDVGTFKSIGLMKTPRVGQTATVLNDGTVLVTGGFVDNTNPPTKSTEVYCTLETGPVCVPGSGGTFVVAANMNVARDSHTATLLPDGTVLLAGGDVDGGDTSTSAADLYCSGVTGVGGPCTVADGSIQPVPTGMSIARDSHVAVLLADQRVLIDGGETEVTPPPPLPPITSATAELFCSLVVNGCTPPSTFQPAANAMSTARIYHAAVQLTDGRVLVLGGRAAAPPSAAIASTDLFDPLTNTFTASGGPAMSIGRAAPAAIRLGDGRVLVTGGRDAVSNTPASSAEIYNGPF